MAVEALPVVGRGFSFEDLRVGFRFRTHRRTISEADLAQFVNVTWLTEELFTVADDAGRAIKGRAVPAALVYAFAEGLLLPTMQDTGLAFLNATPGEGDALRSWRRMRHGTSLWWHVQSRNKKSVTCDLRRPEGQEIVRRLARGAHIMIENFRPGALERWNLGWDALSAANARLILRRISGYGQSGPDRERPGFAAIAATRAGRPPTHALSRPPPRRRHPS